MAHQAHSSKSCGTNDAFTATKCGYQVSIAPSCPGGATDMNASGFPYNITVAGDYKLTANAGADATVNQITFSAFVSGQVTICLGGFTLTGGISYTGRSAAGLTIESGIVNCSMITQACVHAAPNTGTWTGAITFDSLQVTNSGSGSIATDSPGALNLNTGSMAGTISGMPNPGFIFKNLTLTGGSNTTANRIVSLNVFGHATTINVGTRLRDVKVVTSANANAANGAQLYNLNNIDWVGAYVDTSATTSMATLARGIAFDGQDNGGNQVSGWVRNAIFNANTGRPWRCRGCGAATLENFQMQNVQATNEGALHLCDNDNGKGQASGPIVVQNGTIDIGAGTGVYVRGCDSVLIRNVSFNCYSGGCATGKVASIGPIVNDETSTTMTIMNNTVSGSIGTGWVLGTGSVVSQCSTGTFSGSPAATTISPCP